VAHTLGAARVRTALLMGRRYESFDTADAWWAFHVHWAARLVDVARLAERAQLVVGVENHKDWLAAELASMVRAVNSPALGVCLDFGNNLALLEDPVAAIETLAPVTVMTHVKDMAVRVTDEGFEMAEVPLGTGFLPLSQVIATLRRQDAGMRFVLEMITRDPLPVPWRRERYWMTRRPDDREGAERVAATLARQDHAPALPRTSGLTAEAAVQLEDDHVRACLDYARSSLGL
jgi:3-oxoisoapionate decarboxylase